MRALKLLKAHKSALAEQFGVIRLALFGSTVRDSADPDSDIDIRVSLPALTAVHYFGVRPMWGISWANRSISSLIRPSEKNYVPSHEWEAVNVC